MKEHKFGTVFIGGSETIGALPENAVAWLDHFIEANEHFILGDCSGVDLALQNYLNSRRYQKVTVYYSGEACHFNVGKWKAEQVAIRREDDMIEASDCAFLIWDGCSEENKCIMEKLRERGLPVFIYRSDLGRLRVFRRNCELNNKTSKEKTV